MAGYRPHRYGKAPHGLSLSDWGRPFLTNRAARGRSGKKTNARRRAAPAFARDNPRIEKQGGVTDRPPSPRHRAGPTPIRRQCRAAGADAPVADRLAQKPKSLARNNKTGCTRRRERAKSDRAL